MFGNMLTGKVFAPSLGEFGDVYGALNTLFSGLAFSGVIISIILQSAELRATRKEMEAQVSQFELQTKAMQKQVFESTFFNMISLHNSMSSRMRDTDVFLNMCNDLNSNAQYIDITQADDNTLLSYLKVIYNHFMRNNYDKLGHYFRYLYQVFIFIELSSFTFDDKKIYANILRAQISNQEFSLLFINCLCYGRSDKFKRLVEKYSFFEHIYYNELTTFVNALNNNLGVYYGDGSTIYSVEDVKSLYLPSAFNVLDDA
ncbi:hypothetical protein AE1304_02570 [Aeromonas enteropelogenes]